MAACYGEYPESQSVVIDDQDAFVGLHLTNARFTTIACPLCGENNLHHDKVEVFERDSGEDGPSTVTTWAEKKGTRLSREQERGRNPSGRRGGILISFWCENCHGWDEGDEPRPEDRVTLAIYQHKGATYVEWDDVTRMALELRRGIIRSPD